MPDERSLVSRVRTVFSICKNGPIEVSVPASNPSAVSMRLFFMCLFSLRASKVSHFLKNVKLLKRGQNRADKPIKCQTAGQLKTDKQSYHRHKIRHLFIHD